MACEAEPLVANALASLPWLFWTVSLEYTVSCAPLMTENLSKQSKVSVMSLSSLSCVAYSLSLGLSKEQPSGRPTNDFLSFPALRSVIYTMFALESKIISSLIDGVRILLKNSTSCFYVLNGSSAW